MRQGLGHRPSQAAAIHSPGPDQRRPTVGHAEQQFRLAARRKNMNVRRAMIVGKDHEAQVCGAVDSRHLKITHLMGYSRAPQEAERQPVGTFEVPTAATSLEDEMARQSVTDGHSAGRPLTPLPRRGRRVPGREDGGKRTFDRLDLDRKMPTLASGTVGGGIGIAAA